MRTNIPKEAVYAVLYGAGDLKLSALLGLRGTLPELQLFGCGYARYRIRNGVV